MRPLKICVLDMNAGHRNNSIRTLTRLLVRFLEQLRAAHPGLSCTYELVSLREGASIPRDASFYVSSGGPGSPLEVDTAPWGRQFRDLLETLCMSPDDGPRLFGICYSFECIVHSLGLGRVQRTTRSERGVHLMNLTAQSRHPLVTPLSPRFPVFEIRDWAIDGDLRSSYGSLPVATLARHAETGVVEALAIGTVIEAVQFHPEADPGEIRTWLRESEQEQWLTRQYGAHGYGRMIDVAANDDLERTFRMVPDWLRRAYDSWVWRQGQSPRV
ncbi:glutamine amidotransferase-related protein [Cystobacter ferrugineus]|uniref:Glutamine amidotransferase domain-containing protein n=1 Tax=Cystobacter ferrugineus TaxID=83449 RepID=A0A1L9AWD8_9BACT|nr:hypothetical protein [Cystobacter ferrugineus]OJH34297.1 hypothetical protein BON30_44090 [Cystobacter ferrugineus]